MYDEINLHESNEDKKMTSSSVSEGGLGVSEFTVNNKTNFIYGLTLGIGYKLSDNVHIDAAYKLESVPQYQYSIISSNNAQNNSNNNNKIITSNTLIADAASTDIIKMKSGIKNGFTIGLRVMF